MNSELIPVVLVFDQVAPNSNINFTFTTAGVYWSLGAKSGDSMGFSVLPRSANGQPQAPLQSIEFGESMLAMRTASDASGLSGFTITLFLRVEAWVEMMQGYCTLNNEATVMAYIGTQRPMQWRNGRISAALARPAINSCGVLVSVQGALPGERICLELSTMKGPGFDAYWSLGPDHAESGGIRLASAQGTLPLASLCYGTRTLHFEIDRSASAASTLDFVMQAYLRWAPARLAYVYLKADCDSNVSVYAQVGNRQPQLVSQTSTVFTL
jgi:hypothetical protein